ncbi:MAG: carotenoid oxygenase family protein [Kiloniellales bacterium]
MAWQSDNPHLSGNFAPVQDELTVADLEVVSGAIPPSLDGAYFRNGANPAFEPLSYTYPFDGDGMVHGVYLRGGKASYRNRFVQTPGLLAERREGRALYGGIADPRQTRSDLLRPGDDPGPIKNGAFIHIVQQGGRLLALYEASHATAMTWELETLGPWTAGGDAPLPLSPHTRVDPESGWRHAIAYRIDSPEVSLHAIDPSGRLRETRRFALPAPTMLHDFVLTERYAVIVAGPVVFDLAAAQTGGGLIQWRPELGTRIALVPLDGGEIRWLETDPFFIFHFANGFEAAGGAGGRIVVDYVRHTRLNFGVADPVPNEGPHLHRMEIDLASSRIEDRRLSDLLCEFPRGNETLESRQTRFTYAPAMAATEGEAAGSTHALMRVDGERGQQQVRDFGKSLIGEAVFVPDPERSGEDEGYLALFRYDPEHDSSDFLLLDARDLEADPVAVVALPRRVPQGLHGSWVTRAAYAGGAG